MYKTRKGRIKIKDLEQQTIKDNDTDSQSDKEEDATSYNNYPS